MAYPSSKSCDFVPNINIETYWWQRLGGEGGEPKKEREEEEEEGREMEL